MGVDLFKLISSSVDQAQLHFFNKCGHAPYREYPQAVTELMVSFPGQLPHGKDMGKVDMWSCTSLHSVPCLIHTAVTRRAPCRVVPSDRVTGPCR